MILVWLQIFRAKKVFINSYARYCYQSKEKVLSRNSWKNVKMNKKI